MPEPGVPRWDDLYRTMHPHTQTEQNDNQARPLAPAEPPVEGIEPRILLHTNEPLQREERIADNQPNQHMVRNPFTGEMESVENDQEYWQDAYDR